MHEQVVDLETIYNKSLEYKKTFPLQLLEDLRVNQVHRESLGVWPSSAQIKKDLSFITPIDIPDIEGALVMPLYNADSRLAHIKLISTDRQGKIKTVSVGSSKLGWFNFINAARSTILNGKFNPSQSLTIHENIQSALLSTDGVYADIVSQVNINQLEKITLRLDLKGSAEFIRKWLHIDRFHITVGKTDKLAWQWLQSDFIFQELSGLDLRVIIPRARDFAKALPLPERETFNDTLKKILKVDLRKYAPLLFERYNDEKQFFSTLSLYFKDHYNLYFEKNDTGGSFDIDFSLSPRNNEIFSLHQTTFTSYTLTLANVAKLVSFYEGDLLIFCDRVCPPPLRYWWENQTETRKPRTEVYAIIREVIYEVFLGLVNESILAR